jgi:hypothetical protein
VLKEIIPLSIYILTLLAWTSFMSAAAGVNSVNIFPPTTDPYGLTYDEHVKNFWKWIISLPIDKNPWNTKIDPGKNCANGQLGMNSSVFYLSGNGGGKSDRTCKVPAGKGLFIPVSPVEYSDKEVPNQPVERLHFLAKRDQDRLTSLSLKIGDKEYSMEDLKKYRIHPKEDFQVIFAEIPPGEKSGLFGVKEPGPSKAAADGYYVITEPLKKGNYTIAYSASLISPTAEGTEPNFAQDIAYVITVE